MYKILLKPWLSLLPPETARLFALSLAKSICRIPIIRPIIRFLHSYRHPGLEREVFGLTFSHPVGLAAGMDTNGDFAGTLANFGFSFIESGSLTPLPESGNPRPRVFRMPKDNAIVHHLGSANKGIRFAIDRLSQDHPSCVLGVSLTHNLASTHDSLIIKDFETSFSMMYDFADYFTINLSSANGNDVLALQDTSTLADILDPILELRMCYETYKPILIKVSTDIPFEQVDEIVNFCRLSGIDGIIAGGSPRYSGDLPARQSKLSRISTGFISGAPVYEQSLALVRHISSHTQGRFPIIACGGITTPQQAGEMLDAGASLIQLYTGIVQQGPRLVRKTLKYLESRSKQ